MTPNGKRIQKRLDGTLLFWNEITSAKLMIIPIVETYKPQPRTRKRLQSVVVQ